MTVLFISSRPMPRCENITAVYDAYPGPKIFDRMYDRTSYILSKSNYDYDLVVTDEPVKESKAPVVMLYHGAALGKRYLLQRNETWERETVEQCSKLITAAVTSSDSPEAIKATMEQCGIDYKQVHPLGMPRMDEWIGTDWHTWYTSYLYLPTFRSFEDKSMPDIDLKKIDDLLTDDEIFIIKPHMIMDEMTRDDISKYKHIVYLTKDIPSEDRIASCDVLVTDYSSAMFDAHAFGKPVVLFEKDAEEYLKDPGMCLSYPGDYSSRHCRNEEDLVTMVREAAKNGPNEEDEKCRKMTVNMCDGHATERVIKLINDLLEE